MATVAFTQLINAPAVELWRVFTDLPRRADWLRTVEAVTVLTPGGFGAGTSWREYRVLPDSSVRIEEFLVVEAVPAARLTVVSAGSGANYRTTYTFTPVPAGRPVRRPARAAAAGRAGATAVRVVQEGCPTAVYGRLLALVLGGFAAQAGEGALRRDLAYLAAATRPGPASAAA